MKHSALQSAVAWTEDRALLRSNPSADPGAKTGVGTGLHRLVPLPYQSLRDWHQCDKPSRHDAATLRHDATTQLANAKPSQFQFTLNQDNRCGTLIHFCFASCSSRFSRALRSAISASILRRYSPVVIDHDSQRFRSAFASSTDSPWSTSHWSRLDSLPPAVGSKSDGDALRRALYVLGVN